MDVRWILLQDLFRLFDVVRRDGKFDQIPFEADYVKRLQVEAGIGQTVRDVGQFAGAVLPQHSNQLALLEANIRLAQGIASRLDVVWNKADDRLIPKPHGGRGFGVTPGPRQHLSDPPCPARPSRQWAGRITQWL